MSQRLILPFKKTTIISAGYKNQTYFSVWGFPHYGLDWGCKENGYKVYACGNGKVVKCGLNNGNIKQGIGNCVVIQYPNVELNDGSVKNISCRMFHFDKIYVKNGQTVTSDTVVGDYGNSGKYYDPSPDSGKHLHIEFGTNYNTPTQSIGISTSSAGVVITQTKTDISIDPSSVWFKGDGQSIEGQTSNWYANKDVNLPNVKDKITKKEGGDIIESQKLILPVNNMLITASYKNKKYESIKGNTSTGFMGTHYGVDFTKDTKLWASGNGIVIKTGFDSCFGDFVVIKYDNVFNRKLNKVQNIIFRYFHLANVKVKQNEKVNKDTNIGIMGSTGQYSNGVHTHLEADTDVTNWANTPTLIGNTTYFKKGIRGSGDTTFNPLDILYIKKTAPDNQKLSCMQDGYVNSDDFNIPSL